MPARNVGGRGLLAGKLRRLENGKSHRVEKNGTGALPLAFTLHKRKFVQARSQSSYPPGTGEFLVPLCGILRDI